VWEGGLVLLFGNLDMRTYDTLIGFAAGVMTAVATTGMSTRRLLALSRDLCC
jgi:hypothetical protein